MGILKAWLSAFRLRTLPLALSCIFMASFLAKYYDQFEWDVFVLAAITTLLLQILSNLANDYGDAVKGTDNENRLGPMRSIQSGAISMENMKIAVIIFIVLSFCSGIALLLISFPNNFIQGFLFFILGLAAIAAAVKYTVGSNALAYSGLGDLFVLIFFGLVGVIGTFYLFSNNILWELIFPALSIGMFSVGVLNLNNLRDVDNDAESGKNTIVVRFGERFGKIYHLILVLGGWLCAIIFTTINWHSSVQLTFLFSLPIFVLNLKTVFSYQDPKELIPSLKQLALGTFIFTLLFGVGLIMTKV